MSSFNVHARKVRNVYLPLGLRRSAFASCIWSSSRLFHQTFDTIYPRFSDRFGFGSVDTLTETQLDLAMNVLEIERNNFLVKLYAFERHRRHAKLCGRRSPSKVEIEALDPPDWDVVIVPEIRQG